MKHITSALCLVVTAILVVSITSQKPTTAPSISFVTDGTSSPTARIDWSMVGQAIAALISAIVGILQLFRDLFSKTATVQPQPGSQLIQDTIQHGSTLVPSAETLGDVLTELVSGKSGDTGAPAFELKMRVVAEKLLTKYTITRKP